MRSLIIALSLIALSAQSETLDEALSKTRHRFELKDAKKQRRDEIKARYKTQISSLREQQKSELKAVSVQK